MIMQMIQKMGDNRTMRKIFRYCSSLGSYCPYTIFAKKAIRFARGDYAKKDITDRERYLLGHVKSGLGIALIGVFCPIFWLSLFSGAKAETLYFNAAHSGIVILIGCIYSIKYYWDLVKERNRINMMG